ncbi:hypothetical protein GQ42DRAFT_163126, partial [Ramicandelaber brevisporus]
MLRSATVKTLAVAATGIRYASTKAATAAATTAAATTTSATTTAATQTASDPLSQYNASRLQRNEQRMIKPYNATTKYWARVYERAVANTPCMLVLQNTGISSQDLSKARIDLQQAVDRSIAQSLAAAGGAKVKTTYRVKIMMVKNALFASVLKGTLYQNVSVLMAGTSCVAFVEEVAKEDVPADVTESVRDHVNDAAVVSGLLNGLVKHRRLICVGGFAENALLTESMLKEVAKMPSLLQLRANLAGALAG